MHKRLLNIWSKSLFLISGVLLSTVVFAQNEPVAMADTMRSNGKIYVVVAVCVTILSGLFVYVFSVDRKLSRVEKEMGREG